VKNNDVFPEEMRRKLASYGTQQIVSSASSLDLNEEEDLKVIHKS